MTSRKSISLKDIKPGSLVPSEPSSESKKRKDPENLENVTKKELKKPKSSNNGPAPESGSVASQRQKAEEWAASQTNLKSTLVTKKSIKPPADKVVKEIGSSPVASSSIAVQRQRAAEWAANQAKENLIKSASKSIITSPTRNTVATGNAASPPPQVGKYDASEDESYATDMATRLNLPIKSANNEPFHIKNVNVKLFAESKSEFEIQPNVISVSKEAGMGGLSYLPVAVFVIFIASVFGAVAWAVQTYETDVLNQLEIIYYWTLERALEFILFTDKHIPIEVKNFIEIASRSENISWAILHFSVPIGVLCFAAALLLLIFSGHSGKSNAIVPNGKSNAIAEKVAQSEITSVTDSSAVSSEMKKLDNDSKDRTAEIKIKSFSVMNYRTHIIIGVVALFVVHKPVFSVAKFVWHYPIISVSLAVFSIVSFYRYRWLRTQAILNRAQASFLAIVTKKLIRDKHANEPCPIEYMFEELLDVILDGTWKFYVPPAPEGSNGSNYDSFVPSVNRKKLNILWEDVKKFIEEDKRIQVVNAMVNGANRKCWRYVSTSIPVQASTKSWFGFKS